jgi:hypothetical protein
VDTGTLERVHVMAKKRNDGSAKIDSEVLLRVHLIVSWRKHKNKEDEHLSAAEYMSEILRRVTAAEYEKAVEWHAQQLKKKKAE